MRRRKLSKPTQVTVRLAVPFLGEVSGVWAPVDAERRAAWELYVELVTRVSVIDLAPGEGLLREALSSLYSLFSTTRDILRRYGPDVAPRRPAGEISFGVLSVTVLNGVLRPVLARWHPALTAYEGTRPHGVDPVQYERDWDRADELRSELATIRRVLGELARILAGVAGAEDLLRAPGGEVPRKSAGGGVAGE